MARDEIAGLHGDTRARVVRIPHGDDGRVCLRREGGTARRGNVVGLASVEGDRVGHPDRRLRTPCCGPRAMRVEQRLGGA